MELTHVAVRAGRLSSFLKGELRMSTGLINKLKWGDAIRVNNVPQHTDFAVQPGDVIMVALDEPAPEYPAQQGQLTVLFEDDHILAVDKPAGILIHLPCGKMGQLVEQVMTNSPGDLPGAAGAHTIGCDIAHQAKGCAQQHHPAVKIDAAQIPGRHFLVENGLHESGDHQLRVSAKELDGHGEDHVAKVGADIVFESSHAYLQNVLRTTYYFTFFSKKCKAEKEEYFSWN